MFSDTDESHDGEDGCHHSKGSHSCFRSFLSDGHDGVVLDTVLLILEAADSALV